MENSPEAIPSLKESLLVQSGALPEDFFTRVLGGAITARHFLEFEEALKNVPRWQSSQPEYSVANKEHAIQETVLDHVNSMLLLVNELEQNSPHLRERVSFDDVRIMILMHDLGETLRGDIPRSDQGTKNFAAQKHTEGQWANRLLRSIADEGVREKIATLFNRYNTRDLADAEAQIAKYIDVVQSAQFGARSGLFSVYARHGLGYQGAGSERVPGEFSTRHDVILRCLRSRAEVDEFSEFVFLQLMPFLKSYYPTYGVRLIEGALKAFLSGQANELPPE